MDNYNNSEEKQNDQITLRIFLYFFLYPGENKELRNMISHSFDFFDYREDQHHWKDPVGLKKVISSLMNKYNYQSYMDFALKFARLPKQLFDDSTEIRKKRIESFDRAAIITYSLCLAKPAIHAQCYIFQDFETKKDLLQQME